MENRRIQEALSDQSIYTYPGSTVLINKLNITDQKELDKMDATLTCLRINNLGMQENKFSFTAKYYLDIHKYIFQDIYPFAGDIRAESISKGNITFCLPKNIYNWLEYLLNEMRQKIMNIKTREDYIEYLSYFYSELNMVHPFRDGNGRTLREYLRQLVEHFNNYLPLSPLELNYSNISEENRKRLYEGSSASASTGDTTLLKEFFDDVLKEKKLENEKSL